MPGSDGAFTPQAALVYASCFPFVYGFGDGEPYTAGSSMSLQRDDSGTDSSIIGSILPSEVLKFESVTISPSPKSSHSTLRSGKAACSFEVMSSLRRLLRPLRNWERVGRGIPARSAS